MTDNKKVVKGTVLGRVKAAEDSLAREYTKQLETALPEGHPLRAEMERQKAMLGGDLAGLPPGHPLLRVLETAKMAYERAQSAVDGEEGGRANSQIKKAKKVSDVAARRQTRASEDEKENTRHRAAKDVNGSLESVLVEIRKAWKTLGEHEPILSTDMYSRRKVVRIRSLLAAVERGLTDNRISRI